MSDAWIDDDAATLRDAMAEAGSIAMQYFGKDPKSWKKHDVSPVSEADLAVNECLHRTLAGTRRDYGWLSEESVDDPDRLTAERVWIVDPIDGTRVFLEGKPEFTICAALAVSGAVELAYVFNPARGEHFVARRGQGAFLNGEQLTIDAGPHLPNARLIGRRNVMKPARWRGDIPDGKRGYIGSLAYQLCLVAKGDWDGAISVNRLHEWDIAAAGLILTEAGGVVTDQRGAVIHFNRESPRIDGMICAGSDLHGALRGALIPKEPT